MLLNAAVGWWADPVSALVLVFYGAEMRVMRGERHAGMREDGQSIWLPPRGLSSCSLPAFDRLAPGEPGLVAERLFDA